MTFSSSSRYAGLLVPVFALRRTGDFGIGDTRAVRDAIDFCRAVGFSVLQILPIHETIGDHSPYNPVTSRGLSPALLSLEPEDVPGLSPELLDRYAPADWLTRLREGPVRHSTIHALKLQVLLAAHRAFLAFGESTLRAEFAQFQDDNADWLPAFTLYRLLVREYEGNPSWTDWRPVHQQLASAEQWLADHDDRARLEREREGFAFVQWVAFRQWTALRDYATQNHVFLMGEVSFGVSRSGADVWARPELFDLAWNMGTPPIAYFDTNKDSERFGQNWGFPPYRWSAHREDGFRWLRARLRWEGRFFHLCRLDHLRGYFRAYMFPWGGGPRHAEVAKLTEEAIRRQTGGLWPRFVPGSGEDPETAALNEAQGREIISVMRHAAGDMFLFAEIMGQLPAYMQRVLDDLKIPNLIFPQLERNEDRTLRAPETYRPLSLCSYANHDHAPLAALYLRLRAEAVSDPHGHAAQDMANLLKFIGWTAPLPGEMNDALLAAFQRALFATPCLLATLMSSDLLGVPQRFNLPGSYGAETWNQRLEKTLSTYADDPVFGPRIATAAQLIAESGRTPPESVRAAILPV